MRTILTSEAPLAIGPYSQAVRANGFIFVAGQLAIDPATQQLISGGVTEQTERALNNIAAILRSCGSRMEHIVRCIVYLKNMEDFSAMNEAYTKLFSGSFPARTTIAVAALPRGGLVEIEATAID
jgi:2-iminobutanoate/2-iminopropanoate deaminase